MEQDQSELSIQDSHLRTKARDVFTCSHFKPVAIYPLREKWMRVDQIDGNVMVAEVSNPSRLEVSRLIDCLVRASDEKTKFPFQSIGGTSSIMINKIPGASLEN